MATQLIKGNTAVIIGAMYAGCDCYFGYPITPATEVLHEASKYFPMVGRKFVQAESEEAAINMVYGASAAGHRVMTASSGPGIMGRYPICRSRTTVLCGYNAGW